MVQQERFSVNAVCQIGASFFQDGSCVPSKTCGWERAWYWLAYEWRLQCRPIFDAIPQGKDSIMQKLFAFSLIVALAACPALAQDEPDASAAPPGICIRPSLSMMLVANYEGSLSEALDEDALTEKEEEAFLVDFEATMAVKQSRLELVRAIHQLQVVEKKCKGTPAGDEATQLLKLLPQCKDLQPGRTATATASRKGTPAADHGRVAASEATKTK